jgi:hypothetical protein
MFVMSERRRLFTHMSVLVKRFSDLLLEHVLGMLHIVLANHEIVFGCIKIKTKSISNQQG